MPACRRAIVPVLCALAGCGGSSFAVSDGQPGLFEPSFPPCASVQPSTLELDGEGLVTEREPGVASVERLPGCTDARLVEVRIDDPTGVFELGAWEAGPVVERVSVEVRLIGDEPGFYEGQLLFEVEGLETEVRAVQLFGEVPEP